MEKKQWGKRIIAWLLAFAMVIGMAPTSVFSAEEKPKNDNKEVITTGGSSEEDAIEATGTNPRAPRTYSGKAWFENEPAFGSQDKGDEPVQGLRLYLQWMDGKGVISPIFTTVTQPDGSFIFDLSKPVAMANGKTTEWKLENDPRQTVRVWPELSEKYKDYSVVKNGDMLGAGFGATYNNRQATVWEAVAGRNRVYGAQIQLQKRPNIEGWLTKPEKDWTKPNTPDGYWANKGNYGAYRGKVWYEVKEATGAVTNEYLMNKNRGDVPATGMKVVASYVNDEVARQFDAWEKANKGYTHEQFKQAQKEIIAAYDKENGEGSAIAETVETTVDKDGNYYIPFRGLYGVSRDRMNPIAQTSNKITKEQFGKLVEDKDVTHSDSRPWDGIVNLVPRHINYDYSYVYPEVGSNRDVWMKMFEDNMFQSTYSIGGQLNAGTSISGLQFAIQAPRPLHTITNYDTNERFAVPGNTAQSVTKGLHPNMNYKVRWFKDGKPVGEPVTMTSDEKGEFGSVPITVPTDLDKEAIYTSAVFPESSEADDITDCLYADSFLAKLQPSVKLHRNLNKDDQEVKTVDATAKATEEDKANNLVDLPVVRDDAEYKVDDTKDRYFVGWASTPDATEPDKNELVTEDYVKTHPNADIYVRDGSKYKIPAEKNTKDLYAVWKDPFTVKVKKEWTNTKKEYKTEGLKFGLLRRPAIGPYGHEVVSNASIYKPLEGSMKDFNKDGMTWDKVPSYDAEGHRLSYVVVELATKEQQEAFAKGDKTWATYRANIIEKDEKNNNHPSKQQTVNLPKTSDGKLDSFTAATVRKHITKDGKELNPHGDGKDINVGYFDTVGYSIVATNKKIDIEPPTINQAKAGDQQVTISHKEEGIEEFKGTLTLDGKETPFSAKRAKRDPQTNTWTVTDDKGNEIPGVSADNSNPSDNKLVLKTPVLKEGDSVKAIAVRRDVESPAAEMHVKDMKSKLPTHIKQEYSEDKDKAVVTAKIYTEEINGAETIMADPDTIYTLVDKDGKPVEGVAPVKANGTQIKFEIPKDKVKEGEEYFIQSAAPRKEPNDTRAVEGKASENGTPSDKSVKLDITAPKVEGDKLPTVSGFTDGEVSGTAKVTEPNGPVTVKDPAKAEEALPSGITLQGGKDAVKVSGHTPNEKIGPYKAILEDKFGNAAEYPGEVRILAKVRDDIKDLTPEEQAKYSKVTFQSDDHSKLVKDGKEVTEIAKYILKDFNQDGKVDADDKITAHQAANAGLVEPTKKIEDKYIFKNWDPDFLSEGIDPSKDNTFKIVTELNDDASKYNPKGQDINTKVGENPNPEDGINNRYDLPKDAKYSFKNPVDTSKPGDVPAVVVVTYPDGSKDEVPVTVHVADKKDAEKYDPKGQDINVKKGETPNAKDGIKDADKLPEGTKFSFKDPVDTTTVGDKPATVVVTYPDGTTDEVPVTVHVTDPKKSDAETYDPKGQDINTEVGKTPNAADGIQNKKDLPEGTKYSFKDPVDTKTPGDKKATVVVTYPDGTKDEVPVTVHVAEPKKTDAEKYDPKGQDITVGQYETPKAADAIANKKDLPEGTKYSFKTPVDTKTPGDKKATVVVTYPDGTKDEVPVTVHVTEKDDIIEVNPKDPVAEGFIRVFVLNKDKSVKVEKAYDVKKESKVTYADVMAKASPAIVVNKGYDGSKRVWTLKPASEDSAVQDEVVGFNKAAKPNNMDTLLVLAKPFAEPVGKDLTVGVGDTVKAEDAIANKDKLPEGTTYKFEQDVDTSKPGTKKATVVVTYPDGTVKKVPVTIEVKDNRETSAQPDVNPIKAGDKTIGGKGVPGSEITVTLPDGTKVTTKVDKDGNWTVEVPEGTDLKDGDKVSVVQTEPGKKPSAPKVVTVKDQEVSKNPEVNPVKPGDKTIGGKGEPGSDITVTLPDGTKVTTKVDKDGNWSVDVPDGTDLKDGDKISVVQTEPGKKPSPAVEVTVKKDEEKSEKPAVDPIHEGDTKITGKGKPGATIVIELPGNTTIKVTVDKNGNFHADLPKDIHLKEKDAIKVIQIEPGKKASDAVIVCVQKAVNRGTKTNTKGNKAPKTGDVAIYGISGLLVAAAAAELLLRKKERD